MRARCAPRACRADGDGPLTRCALLLCVAVGGCSASAAAGSDGGDDGGEAAALGDGAPTYAAVYAQVLVPNCALAFCHGGAGDYLQLASGDVGYASLVRTPAEGPLCAPTGLSRVEPGHPERSLLFLKITDPPCGSLMPLMYGYTGMLTTPQIDQIGQWITCGALAGNTPCPIDAGVFAWDGATGSDAGTD